MQLFTAGRVLKAAQMRQIERNIRDHRHGVDVGSGTRVTNIGSIVSNLASAFTVPTSNYGVLHYSASGFNVGSLTLPPAVTAGDGWYCSVINDRDGSQINLRTSSGETINGFATGALFLTSPYQANSSIIFPLAEMFTDGGSSWYTSEDGRKRLRGRSNQFSSLSNYGDIKFDTRSPGCDANLVRQFLIAGAGDGSGAGDFDPFINLFAAGGVSSLRWTHNRVIDTGSMFPRGQTPVAGTTAVHLVGSGPTAMVNSFSSFGCLVWGSSRVSSTFPLYWLGAFTGSGNTLHAVYGAGVATSPGSLDVNLGFTTNLEGVLSTNYGERYP